MATPLVSEKPPIMSSAVEPQSERSQHVVDGRLLELERIYGVSIAQESFTGPPMALN
jgi:hypothetical protein